MSLLLGGVGAGEGVRWVEVFQPGSSAQARCSAGRPSLRPSVGALEAGAGSGEAGVCAGRGTVCASIGALAIICK